MAESDGKGIRPMSARRRTVEIDRESLESLGLAAESGEPTILTRDGRPVAALISVETMVRLQWERELLRRLALGELESAAGEGDELATVLEDCRLLLEQN
jgi:PHD/YefM family antitoxin component YafN of YafNO toxin-antitoxin module